MDKKFEKKQEKSRRKMLIEEYREENPYIPTDEEILENNSKELLVMDWFVNNFFYSYFNAGIISSLISE